MIKTSNLLRALASSVEYKGDSEVKVRILTRDKEGGVIKVQKAEVTYVNLTAEDEVTFLCIEKDRIEDQ